MPDLAGTGPVRSLRMGKGEPLVLIHPFTTNARIWRGVAEELSDRFDILMVTLPGHYGGDPASFTAISIDGMADAVEAAMDEVGWKTAHVAGNSLGGWLSLELAKRGRARTATPIAPAGAWEGRWDYARTLPVAAKFLAILPLALAGRYLEPVIGGWPLTHRIMLGIVSANHRAVEPQDARAMLNASTHCSGYVAVLVNGFLHGGMRDVEQVEVPVRLVLCEKDKIIPPDPYGTIYAERLPNVETILLENVGHVPMLEAPELIAELIADHALRYRLPVAI